VKRWTGHAALRSDLPHGGRSTSGAKPSEGARRRDWRRCRRCHGRQIFWPRVRKRSSRLKPHYTTVFSAIFISRGFRSFESLTAQLRVLAQRYGNHIIHDSVAALDPVAKNRRAKSGPSLPYDRVVVAPGIAFNTTPLRGMKVEQVTARLECRPTDEAAATATRKHGGTARLLLVAPPTRSAARRPLRTRLSGCFGARKQRSAPTVIKSASMCRPAEAALDRDGIFSVPR